MSFRRSVIAESCSWKYLFSFFNSVTCLATIVFRSNDRPTHVCLHALVFGDLQAITKKVTCRICYTGNVLELVIHFFLDVAKLFPRHSSNLILLTSTCILSMASRTKDLANSFVSSSHRHSCFISSVARDKTRRKCYPIVPSTRSTIFL